VQNKSEIEEAKRIIRTATEYIIAMSIELERRDIATDESQAKRNLELSAYFTKPILELPHRQIALMSAMKLAYTKKNHVLAAHFASRVLANSSQGKNAENARKIKAVSERSGQDAIEIEYDQFAEFDICAASYTPIYSGQPFVQDPFTGAKYHPRYKGSICRVSQVTEIGAPASGLRLLAQ
jgi:coatomer protein complex subunit alpha (xenin)